MTDMVAAGARGGQFRGRAELPQADAQEADDLRDSL
jgi:hypothetical protein